MSTITQIATHAPRQGAERHTSATRRGVVSHFFRIVLLLAALAAFVAAAPLARAQTLTTLHMFTGTGTDGKYLYGSTLVKGPNGDFYGMTNRGGSGNYGTVFSITPDGTLTTLDMFNRLDGSYPRGALVLGTDGNFYGMTNSGGANDVGTVFSMTPQGTLTTLHSFTNTGTDGAYRPRVWCWAQTAASTA